MNAQPLNVLSDTTTMEPGAYTNIQIGGGVSFPYALKYYLVIEMILQLITRRKRLVEYTVQTRRKRRTYADHGLFPVAKALRS